MNIVIDNDSGFCFGVRRAIATLEDELQKKTELYCVGDIVHNEREIERLERKGLKVIDVDQLNRLSNTAVLFRAHGEPPSSYETVRRNSLKLTDATCPVVLKLQRRIRRSWEELKTVGGQLVLFGKKGHAEVIGLMGQTDNECILVENIEQIDRIDPNKPTEIFAQTTKDPQQYADLISRIKTLVHNTVVAHDSICHQMADRAERLRTFACEHDMMLFVGGAKSSNSKVLFEICRSINPNSHFVTAESDIDTAWLKPLPSSIGIFGATSTPLWLMQRIKETIETLAQ